MIDMTKAEQKKKASQEKHAFITAAAQIIPRKALDLLCGSRLNLKVNLTVKNQNCYFNLHRFYEDFNVQIYRSGDIDVELRDLIHNEVKIRLVFFEEAVADYEKALRQFEEDITLLIDDFINGDWSSVMDYMAEHTTAEGTDWRAADKAYREDVQRETEEEPD